MLNWTQLSLNLLYFKYRRTLLWTKKGQSFDLLIQSLSTIVLFYQVQPLSKDAVVQQLGSMQVQLKDELDLALARADLSQVNEVALMYASLINMASKNGSAGYYAWVVCILFYLTTYIHMLF